MAGNHGSYLVLGGLIGIRCDEEVSRNIHKKIGENYDEKSLEHWQAASPEEKRAYLTDHHEIAHHQHINSCIYGILRWRIDQVWYRGIWWASEKLASLDIYPDKGENLWEWWQKTGKKTTLEILKKQNKVGIALYIDDLLKNAQQVEHLKSIIFGEEIDFEITRGEFCSLLNNCFKWMGKRSGVLISKVNEDIYDEANYSCNFKSRSPKEKLFSKNTAFNLNDIFEAFAICKELERLELLNDTSEAKKQFEQLLSGKYECIFSILKKAFISEKWQLGFSPFVSMTHLLFVGNLPLEVSLYDSKSDNYIEDFLPWIFLENLQSGQKISFDIWEHVLKKMYELTHTQIISEHSSWLKYIKFSQEISLPDLLKSGDPEVISLFITSLRSHGVNQSLYTFKQNIHFACQALAAYCLDNEHMQIGYRQWKEQTYENILLVEYLDSVLLYFNPMTKAANILKVDEIVKNPFFIVVGVLLESHHYHMIKAFWGGKSRPDIQVILKKLRAYYSKHDIGPHETPLTILESLINKQEIEQKLKLPNTIIDPYCDLYCDQ